MVTGSDMVRGFRCGLWGRLCEIYSCRHLIMIDAVRTWVVYCYGCTCTILVLSTNVWLGGIGVWRWGSWHKCCSLTEGVHRTYFDRPCRGMSLLDSLLASIGSKKLFLFVSCFVLVRSLMYLKHLFSLWYWRIFGGSTEVTGNAPPIEHATLPTAPPCATIVGEQTSVGSHN